MNSRLRAVLALTFLLFQASLMIYAQFTPWRYFCWAPNDYANTYSLAVNLNGTELSPDQARARYHLEAYKGSYENPASHIMDLVKQYESTYGRNDDAYVTLRWSLNGHKEQTWHWPQE
jgi:hypothetical protein